MPLLIALVPVRGISQIKQTGTDGKKTVLQKWNDHKYPKVSALPEQDCIYAITVCQDIYMQPSGYIGCGMDSNEVNTDISCLGGGELNSVWYRYKTLTPGLLAFTLTPNLAAVDYDWAVFNLTQATCANIYTDTSLVVSCNFSAVHGQTGPNGGTGIQENPQIPVLAGETYVILLSRFAATSPGGYTLDFSASTATMSCDMGTTEKTGTGFNIYPNPTDGKIFISPTPSEKTRIEIYGISGNLLLMQSIPNEESTYGTDLSFLPAGVYFLKVVSVNGTLQVSKIIKQ